VIGQKIGDDEVLLTLAERMFRYGIDHVCRYQYLSHKGRKWTNLGMTKPGKIMFIGRCRPASCLGFLQGTGYSRIFLSSGNNGNIQQRHGWIRVAGRTRFISFNAADIVI
jgi:hypothetical protein